MTFAANQSDMPDFCQPVMASDSWAAKIKADVPTIPIIHPAPGFFIHVSAVTSAASLAANRSLAAFHSIEPPRVMPQ